GDNEEKGLRRGGTTETQRHREDKERREGKERLILPGRVSAFSVPLCLCGSTLAKPATTAACKPSVPPVDARCISAPPRLRATATASTPPSSCSTPRRPPSPTAPSGAAAAAPSPACAPASWAARAAASSSAGPTTGAKTPRCSRPLKTP